MHKKERSRKDLFGADTWLKRKPFEREHEERRFKTRKLSLKACPFCKSTDLKPALLEWGGTPDRLECKNCGRTLQFTISLELPKKSLKTKKKN